VQFIRDRLRQRGARVLTDFNLAGEGRHFAFFIDVNPRLNVIREILIGSAAAGFSLAALLGEDSRRGNDEDYAEPESLYEIASIKMEVVIRGVEQFVTLDFDFIKEVMFVDHHATSLACPDAI
jgi:hypothetical protein